MHKKDIPSWCMTTRNQLTQDKQEYQIGFEAMALRGSPIYEVPVTNATFVVIQALDTWDGELVRRISRQVKCRLCSDDGNRFGRTNQ